ncbi:MAG: hypothetical protein GY765_24480, partial [bacterium]|nr:hypothetical protein [bacterium]
SPLVLKQTLSLDCAEDNFVAAPLSLAVNGQGKLFIFDRKKTKIFILDTNGRFIKSFGSQGHGPADIGVGYSLNMCKKKLNYIEGKGLLVNDKVNMKILRFNDNGTLTKEYKTKSYLSCYPLIDNAGNFYHASVSNGAVDVYDNQLEKLHTLLGPKELRRYINYHPENKWVANALAMPVDKNVFYDLIQKNQLIIYYATSSTFFLFDNFRLIRKFDIFPQKAMERREPYVRDMEESKKEVLKLFPDRKGKMVRYMPVFSNFFVDKDNWKYFYLQGFKDLERDAQTIYKFNLEGQLVKVLYCKADKYIHFHVKKNNLFYGLGTEEVFVLKENGEGMPEREKRKEIING